ncbi:MAG: nucleotidyltransferase family protein [Sulfurimonas sp.]|nr:nucleotidyltransferase family protein [Sulfurimonas sp.]
MKALLLCAGLGVRLRPVTNTVPKCLVPINAKPLLEYWLDSLSDAGITEFLINTHYLDNQVQEYVKNSIYKKNITLTYEKKLLNTGGTLLANQDFFDNSPFMLVHADNLSFCDFKAFIKSHLKRDKKCEMTMMLFESDTPSSCGIVKLDADGIVQEFYEKVQNPPSNLANGAVYICESSMLKFLENLDIKDIDFSNDVLPKFMGKIGTYLNDIYHRDVGTIESYALAQIECRKFILS